MIYDDKTIHMHEIDMLMHLFMVPGFENHQIDEFLTFYFKQIEKVENFQNCRNWERADELGLSFGSVVGQRHLAARY